MAADSAVTFPGGRVYVGAQKLLPVRSISAGMSVWGLGRVAATDTDVWIEQFIQSQVTPGMSLLQMARALADSLNQAFGGIAPGRMGVHVAGFDTRGSVQGPAFYHVHNGHYHLELVGNAINIVPDEAPPIREFRAHEDKPPQIYGGKATHLTRNGDFGLFVVLLNWLLPLFAGIQGSTGLVFPFPDSLEARGEYLRFWIDQVKDIYRLSNARLRVFTQPETSGDAHIGGPVTVLTISHAGIHSFYTR